jgi:hypothetical protein
VSVSLAFIFGPFAAWMTDTGGVHMDGLYQLPDPWAAVVLVPLGILLLTVVMHLMRGIGKMHGGLAKHLLVAQSGARTDRHGAAVEDDGCGGRS